MRSFAGYRPETSRSLNDDLIGLVRSVGDGVKKQPTLLRTRIQ
jgi:hypothetical protein